MRWIDLVWLPLGALWRQKARTVLTTLGVVFGSFVLAASLSIGSGVQETVNRLLSQTDFLRRISVNGSTEVEDQAHDVAPVEGNISPERRQRLKAPVASLKVREAGKVTRYPLDEAKIQQLQEIPHVESFVPTFSRSGFAVLDGHSEKAEVAAFRPRPEDVEERLIAGRFFNGDDEAAVVVNEFLLYRMGLRDDADLTRVLGRKIRFETFRQTGNQGLTVGLARNLPSLSLEDAAAVASLSQRLPQMLAQLSLSSQEQALLAKIGGPSKVPVEVVPPLELEIVGVTRVPSEDANRRRRNNPFDFQGSAEMLIPAGTAMKYVFSTTQGREEGISGGMLVMQHNEDVVQALAKIQEYKLNGWAPVDFLDRLRMMHRLIFGGMTLIATVALFVAAMGIANTMLMSIIERTREIGVMKSLGATDEALQSIFLIEGLLIGLTGGVLGLLAAWAASIPGDAWVRSMASANVRFPLTEPLFTFPLRVNLLVVGFATFMTTLGAYYPARRAARIDPVRALRHE